jgi:HupE / UreJ protein
LTPAELYLRLGFAHITDWLGYDHMLFLLALVAGLGLRMWRQVLVLVTAFTLGHALTLALTALDVLHIDARTVELLIPLTILLTAAGNLWPSTDGQRGRWWLRYALAMGFGLIHGMGFSSYFRSLLGQDGRVVGPLLWFNCGIELGQLLIVAGLLGLAWVAVEWLRLPARWWRIGVSVLAMVVAAGLVVARMVGDGGA